MHEHEGTPPPDGSIAYDQLPRRAASGLPNSWGVFGAGDQLGTLNRLGPREVLAAAQEVRTGDVFSLDLPLTEPDPPLFGRRALLQSVTSMASGNFFDDRLDSFYPQTSTQWDALRHMRTGDLLMYGGVAEAPVAGEGPLGIEHFAEHGIVGRGILLDLPEYLRRNGQAYDPCSGTEITAEQLREAADWQEVDIRTGDILCVRTGWLGHYLKYSQAERRALAEASTPEMAGLAGDEEVARTLWDWGISAIVADNTSIQAMPIRGSSLHDRLLPNLGFAIGELFVLDSLAEACRAEVAGASSSPAFR